MPGGRLASWGQLTADQSAAADQPFRWAMGPPWSRIGCGGSTDPLDDGAAMVPILIDFSPRAIASGRNGRVRPHERKMAWQQDIRAANAPTSEAATGGTVRARPIGRAGASRRRGIPTVRTQVAGNLARAGTPVRAPAGKAAAATDVRAGPAVTDAPTVNVVVSAVLVESAVVSAVLVANVQVALGEPVTDDPAGTHAPAAGTHGPVAATHDPVVLVETGRGVPVRMTPLGRTTQTVVTLSVVSVRGMTGLARIRAAMTAARVPTGDVRLRTVRTEVVRNRAMGVGPNRVTVADRIVAKAARDVVIAAVRGRVSAAVRGRVSAVLAAASIEDHVTTTAPVGRGSATKTGPTRIVEAPATATQVMVARRNVPLVTADTGRIALETPDVRIVSTGLIGDSRAARVMGVGPNVLPGPRPTDSAVTVRGGRTTGRTVRRATRATTCESTAATVKGRTVIGPADRTPMVVVIGLVDGPMVDAMIAVDGLMVIGRVGHIVTANVRVAAMVGTGRTRGAIIVRARGQMTVRATATATTAASMTGAMVMIGRKPADVRTTPVAGPTAPAGARTARTGRARRIATTSVRAGATMTAATTVASRTARTNSGRGWRPCRTNRRFRYCPRTSRCHGG